MSGIQGGSINIIFSYPHLHVRYTERFSKYEPSTTLTYMPGIQGVSINMNLQLPSPIGQKQETN